MNSFCPRLHVFASKGLKQEYLFIIYCNDKNCLKARQLALLGVFHNLTSQTSYKGTITYCRKQQGNPFATLDCICEAFFILLRGLSFSKVCLGLVDLFSSYYLDHQK